MHSRTSITASVIRALCLTVFASLFLANAVHARNDMTVAKLAISTPTKTNTAKKNQRVSRIKAAPPRIQLAPLQYTQLLSLPRGVRDELLTQNTPHPSATSNSGAEPYCSRPSTNLSASTIVSPCLGLYATQNNPSNIKVLFDLALKSVGAPKDVFAMQCNPTVKNAACNSPTNQANLEQERLADALNQQRRAPVATLGVAVSF